MFFLPPAQYYIYRSREMNGLKRHLSSRMHPRPAGGIMDKIIKVTFGLFIVILAVFAAFVSYNTYIDSKYRNSLSSTYYYSCTFTTDAVMSNVTLFLPVPADADGNSPIVSEISNHNVTGLPGDWSVSLYDTGKATLLKISAPTIGKPAINGSAQTTINMLTVTALSPGAIDTLSPVEDAAVFRPVQEIREITCSDSDTSSGLHACYRYRTSIYADYSADRNATVSISANLDAKNSWTISQPESNEYKNTVSVNLYGENHGWAMTEGWLEAGIGSYNVPDITP